MRNVLAVILAVIVFAMPGAAAIMSVPASDPISAAAAAPSGYIPAAVCDGDRVPAGEELCIRVADGHRVIVFSDGATVDAGTDPVFVTAR